MRITNTMITNNTMRNVNKSKTNLYTTEQQMATQKKINRPSDDPIIAIRALSLRSSISEIDQYLNKNVPDVASWYALSETSLDNMNGILSSLNTYCVQGSTDTFTVDNREAIIQSIEQLKAALYAEGNADISGRYIFTGYRTDTSLTFMEESLTKVEYRIEQEFTGYDFTTTDYMINDVDIADIKDIPAADTPESVSVHRIRLAYQQCKDTTPVVEVNGTAMTVQTVTQEEMKRILSTTGMSDDVAYYVYDKGEVVMSDNTYDGMKEKEDAIKITYEKGDFSANDVRPEHYFDCYDMTNDVQYRIGEGGQQIEYTINFSQSIKINTEARNVLSFNIGRDMDDLINSLREVQKIETEMARLKEMEKSSVYSDDEKASIATMIVALQKQHDYAKAAMEKRFANGITQISGHQQIISTEVSDLGSREVRLTLAKNRLEQQMTTFKDLKSNNEDVELEDIAIEFTEAETVYDAAIATASKTVRQTLLDYL